MCCSRGRHSERSNKTVPNRPVGNSLGETNQLDKGDTFYYKCPWFTVLELEETMYYSSVSLGDEWGGSHPEAVNMH